MSKLTHKQISSALAAACVLLIVSIAYITSPKWSGYLPTSIVNLIILSLPFATIALAIFANYLLLSIYAALEHKIHKRISTSLGEQFDTWYGANVWQKIAEDAMLSEIESTKQMIRIACRPGLEFNAVVTSIKNQYKVSNLKSKFSAYGLYQVQSRHHHTTADWTRASLSHTDALRDILSEADYALTPKAKTKRKATAPESLTDDYREPGLNPKYMVTANG